MAKSLFLHSFLLALTFCPSFSTAYSWHFNAPPTQCSNLSITVTGSDGVPPYRVLIVPFGPSPLSSNIDIRSTIDQPFDGDLTTVNFPVNYPAHSHFIAVVSDASGFGTGGTSVAIPIAGSSDSSCFDPTQQASPLFPFFLSPDAVHQCQQNRIWWNSSEAQGTPAFYAVIPDGQSFPIIASNVTDVFQEGRGFSWVPPIRAGTIFSIIGGDARGIATAGSIILVVQYEDDNSCLGDTSPASTVGTPVGWIHHTHATIGGKVVSNGSLIAGIIAGGTIGGVLIFVLAGFFFLSGWRRRKMRSRPRVLIDEMDDEFPTSRRSQSRNALPEYHRLEPFPLLQAGGETDAYSLGEYEGRRQRYLRRPSAASSSTSQSSLSVKTSYSERDYEALGYQKKGSTLELESPISIIQHEHVGPSNSAQSPIELPPAYTNIKRISRLLGKR
ncbi:hypothetical protein F5887DRAFT_972247 [Amanita rubescens]|nr:hypothetical protein F5887DRAFT_972247 [Amanita rubescens]